MQLYALDAKQNLIPAHKAHKQRNYTCLECQGIVRIRAGLHRQPHFFHLKPALSCHLSAKSMAHIQVQCRLQKLLPEGECRIEERFPQIQRIADVVWQAKRLVFEIQCSPITAKEVQERNQDYASLGYQVIWILHDSQFNQYKVSAAELFLRDHPCYFTNIDAIGHGILYDQFDLFAGGVRKKKMPPLEIDVLQPIVASSCLQVELAVLNNRQATWPLHFAGDLTHLNTLESSTYLKIAKQAEMEFIAAQNPHQGTCSMMAYLIKRCFVIPYRILFQIVLERVCR